MVYGGKTAIAVMGPSRAEDGKAAEALAQAGLAGKSLAEKGYVLLVHGTDATAQAAAQPALAAGGEVMSFVPKADVDLGFALPQTVVDGIYGGMTSILEHADALLIFEGGLEGLSALLQIWIWGLSPDQPYRQVILVGKAWPDAIKNIADALGLDAKTRAMVTFAPTAAEAVESLRYYVSPSNA